MKKTNWLTIGMIVSACVVALGILTLIGAFGGVPANDDSFINSNDGGYARFGTDFYTFVNNNAASAALYAIRTTALLRNVSGFLFIGFGLLSFCYFASKRYCEPTKPIMREESLVEKTGEQKETATEVDEK